jgi:DNA-binding transcriptional LysR family regulator
VQNYPETLPATQSLVWDDVRYFLELARQGKLTAAARILAVEHSTVARRVGALEKQLGVRLFDRLPRSWTLTSEGQQLLAHAQRLEEHALAFSRAGAGAGAARGSVRISAPPVFASHFMVPRLAGLRERWPGITLELIGEARQANLYRREADLAIRLWRPVESGLAAKPLAEMGYGLYATAQWAERPKDQWEFIGYDEILNETPQQTWLEQLAAGRPFVLRSNDLAAIYEACRAGLGVAALPHFLARDDPKLVVFPDYQAVMTRPIWLVIHPDVRRSPRVKAVADMVSDLFREHAPALL